MSAADAWAEAWIDRALAAGAAFALVEGEDLPVALHWVVADAPADLGALAALEAERERDGGLVRALVHRRIVSAGRDVLVPVLQMGAAPPRMERWRLLCRNPAVTGGPLT